jgi:hypothetical protein
MNPFERLWLRTTRSSRAKAEAIRVLIDTPTEEFLRRRGEIDTAGLTTDEINVALAARPDLYRPLLPIERATLRALLDHADFPGRDELVEQVDSATVVGYCPCPCATVALDVSRSAPRAVESVSPIPNSADVLDDNDDVIGGVMIFTEDGYLSALEIYAWENPITPLPPLDRLRPWSRART